MFWSGQLPDQLAFIFFSKLLFQMHVLGFIMCKSEQTQRRVKGAPNQILGGRTLRVNGQV